VRSLFIKIFLSFWLTVVLIGAAVAVTWAFQPDVVISRWRSVTSQALEFYAQSAAEVSDRQGPTALNEYLDRLNRNSHIRAALVDEHGTPVAGMAPERGKALAVQALKDNQPKLEIKGTSAWGAQPVVGPSGCRYVLVAEMARGPFGGFRPPLRKQLLRLALALLISGVICYALTAYLTRPVLRLRTAARQLAAGNLSARASERMGARRDEIGDLVRDFNRMADRIENLVTAQRQLITDISHELRSPLARLNVALGLARQRAGEEAGASLDRIEREAERLNDMIGQLLTLARLDSGARPNETMPVQLTALLEDIVADAQFEAGARHCAVQLAHADECTVYGDHELLRSAIENVVRNAVRYTPQGTQVEVSLSCEAEIDNHRWAVVSVRDFGPGVPDSELPKLFRPFYRAGGARERQTGGVGLGLAITQRALKVHGGTVQARNAEGRGLVVEMRLAMNGVPEP
jgi:two-component system sensor histidine kinase CpxA